jgi:hypothetical protein
VGKSKNIPEERIAYVFEDGAKDRSDLIYRLTHDKKIGFSFAPKSHAALQAADLLAYEHFLATIRVNDGTVTEYDKLRISARKLDAINGEKGKYWGTYRESDLLAFCQGIKIPRRFTEPSNSFSGRPTSSEG